MRLRFAHLAAYMLANSMMIKRLLAVAITFATSCGDSPQRIRPGLPVSNFPQLPAAVAADLKGRGCTIVNGHHVISGDFLGRGQNAWAVLCQRGSEASLFIYTGAGRPAIYNTHPSGLSGDLESARAIRAVDWAYVARHNPNLKVSSPPGKCIEDGVGMGSSIYCYLRGAWIELAGAD